VGGVWWPLLLFVARYGESLVACRVRCAFALAIWWCLALSVVFAARSWVAGEWTPRRLCWEGFA
jgi:hypothetical protein